MPTRGQRIIILGRMEQTGQRPTGKMVERDRNFFPEMGVVWEPHALYWIHKERKGDLQKAKTFASREGYEVLVYPKGTQNPLGKAKAQVQKLHGG